MVFRRTLVGQLHYKLHMVMLSNTEITSKYFGPTTRSRKRPQSFHLESSRKGGESVKVKISNGAPDENVTKKHQPKVTIHWEPSQWLLQLENIRTMRKEKNAPVDTMGCERCTKDGYSEKVFLLQFM